jgi:hypothetical protein
MSTTTAMVDREEMKMKTAAIIIALMLGLAGVQKAWRARFSAKIASSCQLPRCCEPQSSRDVCRDTTATTLYLLSSSS